MGTTFTNCHVRAESAQVVRAAVREALTVPAYVSDAAGGWVSVFADEIDFEGNIARRLSAHTGLPVLHLWEYDSDVGGYRLFVIGESRDEYETDPDWFAGEPGEDGEPTPHKTAEERERLKGNPEALLPYCPPGTDAAAITAALQGRTGGAPRPDTALYELSTVLRIAADRFSATYDLLERDDADFPCELVGQAGVSQEYKDRMLLEMAQWPDRIEQAREWLARGANPNAVWNGAGHNALYAAAERNNREAVRLLLDAAADPHAIFQSHAMRPDSGGEMVSGVTLLMAAALGSGIPWFDGEVLRLLAGVGVDVNARDGDGLTALGRVREQQRRFARYGRLQAHPSEQIEKAVAVLLELGATE